VAERLEHYFKPADLDRIEQAVSQAESRSDGEIALAIVSRSPGRRQNAWLWAGLAGLLSALVSLAATHRSAWGMVFEYGLATTVGVAAFLSTLLVFRLRGTGDSRAVWNEARRRLLSLKPTRARTAVQIYISLAEHQVAVVADTAIAGKVAGTYWEGPRDLILTGFRSGRYTDAVIEAVAEVGACLAEHFPRSVDDTNELPNRPQWGSESN
jgi:putative membrane protein